MLAGFLASACESIGDYHACARLIEEPAPSEKMINLGIGVEGIGCLLEGMWGVHPLQDAQRISRDNSSILHPSASELAFELLFQQLQ